MLPSFRLCERAFSATSTPRSPAASLDDLPDAARRELVALERLVHAVAPLSPDAIRGFRNGTVTWAELEGLPHELLEGAIQLGVEAFQRNDFVNAEKIASCVASLHPIDPRPFLLLGCVALEQKAWERADSAFTAALDRFAGDLGAFAGRALARDALGRRKDAIEDVRRALEADPGGERTLTQRMARHFAPRAA